MQGLVNFATAIADCIAVALPALCYLMACFASCSPDGRSVGGLGLS